MSDFNLGTVTAYGYAKDKGYTGTEDEFAELMASYADVAEQAAESATAAAASATTATTKASEASASATAAATSKTAAEAAQSSAETAATTATTKAGEASTSAATASSKASEATTAATTATNKATEATTAATTATTKAGEAATSATNAAASAEAAAESAATLVIDDTLTHSGQAADAKKVGDEISDLKDDLRSDRNDLSREIKEINFNPNVFTGWRQGYYASSNGAYEPNHNNYVCTVEPFAFNNGDIVIFPDLTDANPDAFYLNFYDDSKSYISSLAIAKTTKNYRINLPNNASGYLHFSFSKSPSISPSTAPKITVYLNNTLASKNYIMDALEFNGLYTPAWLNSIYYWDQGSVYYVANRIGIPFAMIARTPIRVSVNSGYKYAVFTFSSTALSVATQLTNTGWITGSHEIKRGDIFAINMARTDDADITPEEGYANLTIQGFPEKDTGQGFVLEPDLTKNYVKTEMIGSLSYGQSFCIYNGKYYSINGTKIAEQSSDFSVLRDVALNTGHGNDLQLGSGNIAYASGWNDQKIYAVDLETLTIDQEITLPTTGYTTCAVDDLNGIVYIFQRDTLPDTETNYKFIVYDYVNEEIISQKVINKFGAMQAADYYNGKIVICWGLGTATVPSGMAVYDTAGDILAEYSLSIFASAEPEGVCLDRDSKDLFVSIGTALYKIYK